ncbi:MAG: hypothetical protein IKG88_04900 [Bacteroidales bacterium]|nr:hypothetical protein [Bacteroidales bacterium]
MKLLRKILKGISLTSVLFVFQACYGTEPALSMEEVMFKVVSAEDNQPLKDVEVKHRWNLPPAYGEWQSDGKTDEEGVIRLYVISNSNNDYCFTPSDSNYAVKDTTFKYISRDTINIAMIKKDHAE